MEKVKPGKTRAQKYMTVEEKICGMKKRKNQRVLSA